MTNVTNRLKRPVALRDKSDKVVTIQPGETKGVDGLNTKDRFVASLIGDGSITTGGASREEVKQSQTEAELLDAQNAVKNAKDALATAEADTSDTGEAKANLGRAKSALKAAESRLTKAEAAHAKGGN